MLGLRRGKLPSGDRPRDLRCVQLLARQIPEQLGVAGSSLHSLRKGGVPGWDGQVGVYLMHCGQVPERQGDERDSWNVRKDINSGRLYRYQSETGASQWVGEGSFLMWKAKLEETEVTFDEPAGGSCQKVDAGGGDLQLAVDGGGAAGSRASVDLGGGGGNDDWQIAADPATGRKYRFRASSGETEWVDQ